MKFESVGFKGPTESRERGKEGTIVRSEVVALEKIPRDRAGHLDLHPRLKAAASEAGDPGPKDIANELVGRGHRRVVPANDVCCPVRAPKGADARGADTPKRS
jgi:hypothetical protein